MKRTTSRAVRCPPASMPRPVGGLAEHLGEVQARDLASGRDA
ncbi:hypothetical protein [Sorangium sp. So ce233]